MQRFTLKDGYLFRVLDARNEKPFICPFNPENKTCGNWCVHFELIDKKYEDGGDFNMLFWPKHTVVKMTCGNGKKLTPLNIDFEWDD